MPFLGPQELVPFQNPEGSPRWLKSYISPGRVAGKDPLPVGILSECFYGAPVVKGVQVDGNTELKAF